MRSESIWDYAARMGKIVLLIDAILFAGAGIVCWAGGWLTCEYFGTALVYAGVVALALGLMGIVGGSGQMRALSTHFSHTGGDQIGRRTLRLADELRDGTTFTILMGAAAVLPLIVGAILL